MLAVYISGHGFGHATRVGEVLRALRERQPHLPLTVVTSAPRELLARSIPGPFELRTVACDVGLVQKDALVIDEAATADRCRAFAEGWDALVAGESARLRAAGVRVVLGDIPPLAFVAAARAELPSLGLANFSWDWIYGHLAARQPSLREAAAAVAE